MTQALHIETLKVARKLVAAGLDRGAAEAIADGIGDLDTADVATKSDLIQLEQRLTIRIGSMIALGIAVMTGVAHFLH